MARWARDAGLILRFIEYMDVGTRTAGGSTTSSRPPRSSRRSTPRCRSSRSPPRYRGEVAERWRYRRRQRRDRRHRLGHAAVLRRLHPGPALGRGQALHVPLQRRSGTTCGRRSAVGASDADLADAIAAHLGGPRRPLLGAADRGDRPTCRKVEMFAMGGESRTRSRRAARDRLSDLRTSSTAVHNGGNSWTREPIGPKFVDNPLTRRRPARTVRLARRGRQGPRNRDHIKGLEPGPVASGASVPGRDGVPAPSPGEPGGT